MLHSTQGHFVMSVRRNNKETWLIFQEIILSLVLAQLSAKRLSFQESTDDIRLGKVTLFGPVAGPQKIL